MPLEVVVELQIRAISCPGVFLPYKEGVYLGVYLLNQYLETNCFPSVFPIAIQQNMIFEKVFENAIDPGAVAEILESFLTRFELIQLVSPAWEELAYYEENTRDFLFPEPKLTSSHLGMYREVLMKTPIGFPGIAPKLEFSTRTAIRECVFPHRNRLLRRTVNPKRLYQNHTGKELPQITERRSRRRKVLTDFPKAHRPGSPPRLPLDASSSTSRLSRTLEKASGSLKQESLHLWWTVKTPFGESSLEHHLPKSRRKSKFLDFALPMRRASSLESLETNVKVTREPDERIVLRSQMSPPLDSRKSGRPSPNHLGDVELLLDTSLPTSQHSRSSSPLEEPLLGERFHPRSQSTWRKIHERVCSLLTSHRAHSKEDFIPETNYIRERPSYPLKKLPLHGQRYF